MLKKTFIHLLICCGIGGNSGGSMGGTTGGTIVGGGIASGGRSTIGIAGGEITVGAMTAIDGSVNDEGMKTAKFSNVF